MNAVLSVLLAVLSFAQSGWAGSVTPQAGDYSFGNLTRERTVERNDGFYVVQYDYSTQGVIMIPAVGGGQAHYDAEITVFKVQDGKKKRIARFSGQYTDRGCFEDDPNSLVDRALILKDKPQFAPGNSIDKHPY